jgi:arabinan endo-1,5-alpha-L-arabinosidase
MDPLGAPILPAPAPDWHVNDHTFVRDREGRWRMFGIVAANPPRPKPTPAEGARKGPSFGHAASDRLTSGWSFREDRPFHEKHKEGSVLWAPHVVWDGSRYHMFYTSGGDPSAFVISHRTSPDLSQWSKAQEVFTDGWQGRDPMVLRLPTNEWAIYYTATEDPTRASPHVVAVRTSSDLERWSERKIVFTDPHVGKGYGPTESPFVVARDGWYYLFIGPRPYDAPGPGRPNWEHPGYVGSDVFKSRSFDRFTDADFVGHLAVHAAEVVQDVDGRWYVSSAGIRQGGLYLSRLFWDD